MGLQQRSGEASTLEAIGIARDQISKAIRLAEGAEASDREEVVHAIRKRIKKARALVGLVRDAVGRKAADKANRRLREASLPLSKVRDASALIATLDGLAERSVGLVPIGAFDEARSSLVEHQNQVFREVLDEEDALEKATKILKSTRRRMRSWDAGDGRTDPIAAFKRSYKRGRDAYDAACTDPSPDSLHELRKRVKAFEYPLRALDVHPSGRVARVQRLATLLADELGELHDLDVLQSFLEGRAGSSPVFKALDRRRPDLRRGALLRAGVVFFDKPRAFAKALEASSSMAETAQGGS